MSYNLTDEHLYIDKNAYPYQKYNKNSVSSNDDKTTVNIQADKVIYPQAYPESTNNYTNNKINEIPEQSNIQQKPQQRNMFGGLGNLFPMLGNLLGGGSKGGLGNVVQMFQGNGLDGILKNGNLGNLLKGDGLKNILNNDMLGNLFGGNTSGSGGLNIGNIMKMFSPTQKNNSTKNNSIDSYRKVWC